MSGTEDPLPAVPGDLRDRERAENFPVALRILPRRHREDLRAVYDVARTVDELGDAAPGDRTAQLHRFDEELDRIWTGGPVTDPVLVALRRTVTAHDLPAEPFHRLVQANLVDQEVSRWATYDDLLGYCRLSADPVGRVVLGVFHAGDPAAVALSDRVCTALQLLEHWQDVGEDRRAGRIYIPQEDLERYGVAEEELDRPATGPALAELMRFEIERAAALLADGAPIVQRLEGWARVCVAGFVAGGQATVAALRRTDGAVLERPAAPSKPGAVLRLAALLGTAARQGGGER